MHGNILLLFRFSSRKVSMFYVYGILTNQDYGLNLVLLLF